MPHEVDRCLRELERHARALDDEAKRALLGEIRAHLDCAIQARLELGASLEEAERAAVRELGSPKRIARRVAAVDAPPSIDRRYLTVVGLASFAWTLVTIAPWQGWISDSASDLWLEYVKAFGILGTLVAAFLAKRFQWRALVIAYVAMCLWLGGATTINHMRFYRGEAVAQRALAERDRAMAVLGTAAEAALLRHRATQREHRAERLDQATWTAPVTAIAGKLRHAHAVTGPWILMLSMVSGLGWFGRALLTWRDRRRRIAG